MAFRPVAGELEDAEKLQGRRWRRMRSRVGLVAVLALVGAAATLPVAGRVSAAARSSTTGIGPDDWPMYGRSPSHDFVGVTTLDPVSVRTLLPAWFFPTGDAVTAPPTVVDGTVYVGSWDGNVYALDAATGHLRWRFTLDPQPAVSPVPGHHSVSDITSDGGMVTAAATYVPSAPCPGGGGEAAVVLVGGGYTLYSLRASDGHLCWKHAYTGRPEYPPDPAHDETRIFSSPSVVGNHVLFSADADGATNCRDPQGHVVGCRGYLVSADLATGDPQWVRELDVDVHGRVRNDGCGNVWASPTIVEALGIEVVGVADCKFFAPPPYAERIVAVRISDGAIVWTSTPWWRLNPNDPKGGPDCDFDFGATANLGTTPDGRPFLGVGGKDGTYYALDPATGKELWRTRVVFGGFAGGFIGSTAFDGRRVYGATALGDFGRFEGAGTLGCQPTKDTRDQLVQEPSVHAISADDGHEVWSGLLSQSFAPTTVAGGMVFVAPGIPPGRLDVHDAATGALLTSIPLPANSDSGAVPVGNALFVGLGTSEQYSPTNSPTASVVGVMALTPFGVPPQAPPPSAGSGGGEAVPGQAATTGTAALSSGLPSTSDRAGPPIALAVALALGLAGGTTRWRRRQRGCCRTVTAGQDLTNSTG